MSHTCVSCSLEFQDVPGQRSHMKSDWHRYNLKRRVAQLPPISESIFDDKIASIIRRDELPAEAKQTRKQITKKDVRRRQKEALQTQRRELLAAREALQAQFSKLGIAPKTQESKEATSNEENELSGSRSVSQSVPDLPQTSRSEPELSVEEQLLSEKIASRVDIPVTTCLFCPTKRELNFATVEENSTHMFHAHGLYIPERKYLVDTEGLISYLGEKIGLGNVCLVCSYQGKNLKAVREHMMSKRHMKIPYESEREKLEISDFYDFTSSYGDSVPGRVTIQDNDEWEDVSDDVNNETDDSCDNDEIPEDPIINMGTELILPSGAVVGHRSVTKYYRQNLSPDRILTEGQGTVISAETRHFAAPAHRQELAMTKRAWNLQKTREDRYNRRAQKFINHQPHFRDPLLQ